MKFYSTNNKQLSVSFKDAVFNSLPRDRGLYMPLSIPKLNPNFIDNIHALSFQELALEVARAIIEDDIPSDDLKKIVDDTLSFDAPVVKLGDGSYVLELFHGPSLAFKDFGARFMSRIMAYFSQKNDVTLDVLVATSGDTGGAVALGFDGVPNTRVTILYPKGKVSPVQELQLCTNGGNIQAIEVDGTFDDCQDLVKKAFNDDDINKKLTLTSANSINISRLIPQSFYYFNAYRQLLQEGEKDIVFVVPSGNFGNLTAGLFAYKMGLPVKHFVAATNANDVVPRFLNGQSYEPQAAIQTISNAMDVGNPSNWSRILDLFGNDVDELKKLITAYSFNDDETHVAIEQIYQKDNYIACPHTAVAWLAAQRYRSEQPSDDAIVSLSTAHPCKFPDVFPETIRDNIEIPDTVNALKNKDQNKVKLSNSYDDFKAFLMTY
ncbi:threonine synthase [Albibacterium indicum]|uniref:threonine synthase n=1 Tax=Albibacterium indicum TaxID=2292082 RepID=UPI000E537B73|nr:threonine synthase [Pedobacter indicus]